MVRAAALGRCGARLIGVLFEAVGTLLANAFVRETAAAVVAQAFRAKPVIGRYGRQRGHHALEMIGERTATPVAQNQLVAIQAVRVATLRTCQSWVIFAIVDCWLVKAITTHRNVGGRLACQSLATW